MRASGGSDSGAPSRRAIVAGALAGVVAAPAATLAQPIASDALGLRPDGSDQTDALSGALARAADAGRPLALHPGDYRVSGVKMPPGGALVGPRGARLVGIGSAPLLTAQSVPEARILGISLLGDGGSVLIEAEGVRELVLDDLALSGGSTQVRLVGCGGQVTRSRFAAGAVGLMSTDATGLLVVGNVLEDMADNGILIWRSQKGHDGSIVAHNRVRRVGSRSGGQGQNGNAINVFRAGGVRVCDNVLSDLAFSGVRANSADAVGIEGNTIERCGETAIFVEFAFAGAVVAGNVIDTAQNGISAANLDHEGRASAITGNVVRNLYKRPSARADSVLPARPPIDDDERGAGSYGIFAEADATVSGNTLENLEGLGIGIGWGPFLRNVSVVGNVIKGCEYGIVPSVAEGTGAALVASNLIAGARAGAIVGAEWGRMVTADLARAEVPAPLRARLMVHGNMAT